MSNNMFNKVRCAYAQYSLMRRMNRLSRQWAIFEAFYKGGVIDTGSDKTNSEMMHCLDLYEAEVNLLMDECRDKKEKYFGKQYSRSGALA